MGAAKWSNPITASLSIGKDIGEGIFGTGEGYSADNVVGQKATGHKRMEERGLANQNTALSNLLNQYSTGQLDYQGLVKGIDEANRQLERSDLGSSYTDRTKKLGYSKIDPTAALEMAATDPRSAARFAQDQLSGLEPYKQGMESLNRASSLEEQLMNERISDREAMTGRGAEFQLQPDDYQAYGEASGDIARMFGSQEQSLAESLASRGLASAPSGTAQAQFSGLMGNKFEQLGKLQHQIAQDRINKASQMAQARADITARNLAQTQGQIQRLSGQGLDAILNQQAGGRDASALRSDQEAQAAETEMKRQQMLQNQVNTQFDQTQATTGPGFMGIAGQLGGSVLGGMYGGPQGAQAGGTAGGQLGASQGSASKSGSRVRL